ncbi:spermatogenesis-associated protein 31E1-like isoform X2 [Ochotona princeps]|uniref:spermatogenesis-associated protein 31E1-like isoform X2 n=1 Tax=Ochotona princeps TaxID=9978 RepID=UPI00271477C1|nr:spermatogenesis-associated protein 31E1-like isoform X2 [Ochotona princeps]
MKKHLLLLKTVSATWLSPSFTFWVVNLILPILCGVGLFLLLLLCLQSNPTSPPPNRKAVIGKHQAQRRSRRGKKGMAVKACGDCLEDLEEVRNLISLLNKFRRHGMFKDG